MPRILKSYKGQQVTINDKPMNSGGEGTIHDIIGPGVNMVAKLYSSTQKAQELYKKILFMVNNPPLGKAPKEIHDAIIWPTDLLYENDIFVGYVMPKVNQGLILFELTLSESLQKKHGPEWEKFDLSSPDAFLTRMKICYNLAKAVEVLHQSGDYVLVDLKPQNVMIKPNGHFSIIDLDSLQITRQKNLLFEATAFTPEYAPCEFHKGNISLSEIISPSFDNFSLAVIIYQLLLTVHPFHASHEKFSTIEENIEHGLFVHGKNKDQLLVIPAVHNLFTKLPGKLQQLFTRALDHGTVNPLFRPTASEWSKELHDKISNYLQVKNQVSNNISNQGQNSVNPKNKGVGKVKGKSIPQPNKVSTSSPGKPASQPVNQPSFNNQGKSRKASGILAYALSAIRNTKQKITCGKALVYKLFGILFLVAAVWAVIIILPVLLRKDGSVTTETVKFEQLSGMYYGYVDRADNGKQVTYIQIKKQDRDGASLILRILPNAYEGSIFEKLVVNETNNTVISDYLENGTYLSDKNGKIILMSAQSNSKQWYFEKL